MSAENVDNLQLDMMPKEILLEICNYLDLRDIKNLSETSKGFNEFVSTTASTVKKLHLMLNSDSTLQQGKSQLSRSYSQVNISFLEFGKSTGLWLTSNFCSGLRVLKMMHVDLKIADKKLFRKTLQALHALETLQMSECDIADFENSMTIESVEMKALKYIHFSATHLGFLLYLKTPNLNSLKICGKSDLESPTIITSFLADQSLEKLEKLALWQIDFEDFEEIEKEQLAKIQIPLRSLSMHILTAPFQNDENLSKFLHLFTESLTELDVRKMKPEPAASIYELIFTKFHKVKTLRVSLSYAPDDADFYSKLPNNPAVTKLIIYEDRSIKREKALYGFLSKLPNIETLVIKADIGNKENLQFIATNCTKLKTLAVKKIISPEKDLNGVRMPNVENLSVCSMKLMSTDSWKNVVRSFKNLKSLSIHRSDETTLNDRTFNIFTKSLTKLKHLMFGEGFIAIKRVFNQMGKNCQNLQTVELLKKSFKEPGMYERVLKDFKKQGLRFICYDNHSKVCHQFDQYHGTDFWKTTAEFDDEEMDDDYEDYGSDSDDSEEDDSDFYNYFDSDGDGGEGLGDILRMLVRGPGIPWYDSENDEQEMGRFDSDGEWESWDF